MSDLDDALRRVLDDRAGSVSADGGPPPDVVRRAHRRRSRKQAGLGVLAATALVAMVVQLRPAEQATNVISVPRPTVASRVPQPATTLDATAETTTSVAVAPSPSPTSTTRPTSTNRPPASVPPVPALPAGVPRTFVATTPDGRIAVVDTATGEPVHFPIVVPGGLSLDDLSLSADRRFAYFTRYGSDPCSAEVVLVPLGEAGGDLPTLAPKPPAGRAHHSPFPRPGTRDLAFGRSTCGYIGERTNEIVILAATADFAEQTYPGLVPLGWSPDGRTLYAEDEATWAVVALDVDAGGEVTGRRPVPLDTTCNRAATIVAAPSGHLVADMACTTGAYRRDIVEIDPVTGAHLRTIVAVEARPLGGGLSYDAGGTHLLYTNGDAVYRLQDGQPVRIAYTDRYRDVAW